jgi:hypothetical protein
MANILVDHGIVQVDNRTVAMLALIIFPKVDGGISPYSPHQYETFSFLG